MASRYPRTAYGFTEALLGVAPSPIIATRNPTANDKGMLGQQWINKVNNSNYVLTSVVGGVSTWASGANAAANFATAGFLTVGNTLTVTAGGATVTAGGLTVTAGGAAVTGNSAFTGTLSATGDITSIGGNILAPGGVIASAGDLETQAGIVITSGGAAPRISSGVGAPGALAQPVGSIYINTGAVAINTRVYVCTAAGVWTALVTLA